MQKKVDENLQTSAGIKLTLALNFEIGWLSLLIQTVTISGT